MAKLFETIESVVRTEQLTENKFIVYGGSRDIRPELFRLAVENSLTLLTLHEQESTMEKSFLDIIK
jgi:hypothetical protein